MDLISTKPKEGEEITLATFINEVNMTIKSPLKLVREYVMLGCKDDYEDQLNDMGNVMFTVMERWEQLDKEVLA